MTLQIQQKLYEPDISKVPLFTGCSPGFFEQIVSLLVLVLVLECISFRDVDYMLYILYSINQAVKVHEEFFLPREVIIEQETDVDQLYILCNGNVVCLQFNLRYRYNE